MNIKDIITESKHACPNCGGPVVEYSELTEKKDACYYKVKASAKVWPSAYASGRLVQCRKKGAANYGNKSEGVSEAQLDEKCWDTHKQVGMKNKGGRQVPNCVPKESVTEGFGRDDDDYHLLDVGPTRWYRFKDGRFFTFNVYPGGEKQAERDGYSRTQAEARQKSDQGTDEQSVTEDLDAQFDVIEEMVESLAEEHGVDADVIWEDFESVDDSELLETAAWRRKEGKSKKGGLNAKGVASYRRENPGSKLQTAVTTKPSKLKPGSKAAKRRKSFCARMGGVKGPMKKPNGKPTRKALALRKWNC
jgi:hypothetical protein